MNDRRGGVDKYVFVRNEKEDNRPIKNGKG